MNYDKPKITFSRFEFEGKTYLTTGTFQLYMLGMCSNEERFKEPTKLLEETELFLKQHSIIHTENICGVPTFIFDTEEKLKIFEDKYKVVYSNNQ